MAMTAPQMIKPYLFHGVELDYTNKRHPKEAIGTCPFCDKEDHFYVNRSTGLHDCKSCGQKGNVATFLKSLYDQSLEATTDEDYAALAEDRAIPEQFIRDSGYAVSIISGKWLIPMRNPKGTIANLLLYTDKGPFGTPTCAMHLLGGESIKKEIVTVWLVEGPWDRTAWQGVLGRIKKKGTRLVGTRNLADSLLATEVVVASPGAGTFKKEWAKLLKGKEVRILFDNDKAGWEGTQRTVDTLADVAKSNESP